MYLACCKHTLNNNNNNNNLNIFMQDCCFSFKKKKTAINAGPEASKTFIKKKYIYIQCSV